MATGGEETQSYPESLQCPVCFDVFEDATLLSCGHTFCRKCLVSCDKSCQYKRHMFCPLCRKRIKLRKKRRVEGLPANVTVKGIVDDYRSNTGGGLYARAGELFRRPSVEVSQEHANRPLMRVKGIVDLRGRMNGMTAVSDDSVIIGFYPEKGADKIDSEGNTSEHFPHDGCYLDLAHQSHNSNIVASMFGDYDQLRVYSQDGSFVHSKKIPYEFSWHPRITSNSNNEIIIANGNNSIMIYDPSISIQLCGIKSTSAPHYATETRSGTIISSTCWLTNPSKVTAYDRSGRVGDTLTADGWEGLYVAVDNQDRVYVASVNQGAGKLVITQYKMDGLEFRKVFQFEELDLVLDVTWCYMVSLSCDMLAFASGNKLYFIEVHPS